MEQIAFLTVAVGDPRYIEQQKRLVESIKLHHPDAKIFQWTNEYPPGSKPMGESMYGFKVHAVNYARSEGHWKIVWLDTACIVVQPIDHYFDLVDDYGLVVVADENKLINYCHPDAWDYFKAEPNNDWHLTAGSVFVFDFHSYLCERIFYKWEKAEEAGQFGHKDTRQGHRHDESCLSLALYTSGSRPVPCAITRYNEETNPSIIKKHFK